MKFFLVCHMTARLVNSLFRLKSPKPTSFKRVLSKKEISFFSVSKPLTWKMKGFIGSQSSRDSWQRNL